MKPRDRLTIRPTDTDLRHLTDIAAHLRATAAVPFATRVQAVRHALEVAAGVVAAAQESRL